MAKKIAEAAAVTIPGVIPCTSGRATSRIPLNPIAADTTFTRVIASPRMKGLRTMTQIGVVNSSAKT